MIKSLYLSLCVTASLLLSVTAQAQELRLFEQTESDAVDNIMPTGPEQVFSQGNGQPAYTLRSISRFGEQYQAVLISRSGEVVKVNWNAGEPAPVANTGFSVVAAGSGSLSLMHPAGDSCVTAEATGVACSATNQSELRLTLAVPLASNGVAPPPVQGPEQQQVNGFFGGADPLGANANGQNGPQVFINPFSGEAEVMPQISEEERGARQQRQEVRAARLRQFEQERIEDADVPAGMQRVRTPFGDRLMPVRE